MKKLVLLSLCFILYIIGQAAPVITSFSPTSGTIGTTVTIIGTGFSATPVNNIVYFGAIKATVNASTATSITVTVPAGAGSVAPVSVTVSGSIAYSTATTTPTFTFTNTPNIVPAYTSASYGVGTNPASVAIADFNDDGIPDMAIANTATNTVSILLGNGNGTFGVATDIQLTTNPTCIAAGDFNGDGKMDIVTGDWGGVGYHEYAIVGVLLGKGNGTFETFIYTKNGGDQFTAVVVGDFNGDGKADVAMAEYSNKIAIYLGRGDGYFDPAKEPYYIVGNHPPAVTVGDFNGDGKTDLIALNEGDNNASVLLGTSPGYFGAETKFAVGSQPRSVTVGDFNSDGKMDFATANYGSNNVSVLLGNGTGGFAGATNFAVGTNPNSVTVGDFNGDGIPDLATTNEGNNTVSVLLGTGTGTFGSALTFTDSLAPRCVAVGDFDGNGRADMAVVNQNGNNVSILLCIKNAAGVSTQAVTDIGVTSAKGNGNITILSVPNPTQYGVVWSTSAYPDITLTTKTELGAKTTTGEFSSNIAGLFPNTTYHVRAYATNAEGTSYGDDVKFITLPFKISSISPTTGPIGTTVTITGTGFSTTPSDNIVCFGAVKASVSASTATTITLSVPAGAGSIVPVTVTQRGCLAYSLTSSTPTFTLTNSSNIDLIYKTYNVDVGTNPHSVAIGDFNEDGIPDMVTANNYDNTVSVSIGIGDGTFAAAVNYGIGLSGPASVAIGDFNGDGKADLAVTNITSNTVSVMLNNGNGTFASAVNYGVGSYPISVVVEDFNGDGKADLAIANFNAYYINVLLGNGDGTFSATVNCTLLTNSVSATVGDFNSDGKADLVTTDGSDGVGIALGKGNGTFGFSTTYSGLSAPCSIANGDFNGDGKADLAIAYKSSNAVSVWLGDGGGYFGLAHNFPVGTNPFSVAVGDFNGDGKADLVTTNDGSADVSMLLGNGDGSFATAVNFPVGTNPVSVAVGDFNRDGKADLAVAKAGSNSVSILLNAAIVITTQDVTNIGSTTATGHGNILDLGIPNPTAYGVCWNTTGTPTISNSKTDKGTASATGAFTTFMTGLIANTTYNVRAYATNTAGTSYGDEVTFTTVSVPVITSLSPVTGAIDTTVTITGVNFSPTPANNTVWFGAVKATVSASTATSITVTVPAGAGSVVPVVVMANGMTAYSATSTTPVFTLTNTPNIVPKYASNSKGTGTTPYSVTIADFNGDGIPDMATANLTASTVSILLGNGNGTFGTATDYSVGIYPYTVSVGDFNGDGKIDIATANADNNVSVLLGDGTGKFGSAANYPAGTYPIASAVGDFNGDGIPDIATANNVSNNVSVLLGIGDGTFGAATNSAVGTTPYSISVGDFNGDGKMDIATPNEGDGTVTILPGDGTGKFGTAISLAVGNKPRSITVGDFNGDKKPDIATANYDDNNVSVLLGDGTGHFGTATNFAVETHPRSVATGDFNGDGKTDLVTANEGSYSVSILQGTGTGLFGTANNFFIDYAPWFIAVGDFDGNGEADMATASYNNNNVNVLLCIDAAVSTKAVTNITARTATGNGNITSLGVPNPIQYGVIWSIASGPVVSLSTKTAQGTATSTGAFTSNISGLTANTFYHVRAYITNATGTTYGDEVGFTTAPAPVIASLSPLSGNIGTAVTIIGTGFSPTPANNTVYFGAVKATVSASTTTSITVTVPGGAGSVVPVLVMVDGLTAYSTTSTTPAFTFINTPNIVPKYVSTTLGVDVNPTSLVIADFNGDGIPDMATANGTANSVSILLGAGNGAFGAAANITVGTNPTSIAVGDFNNDGKIDIVTANSGDFRIGVMLGNGNGTFGTSTKYLAGSDPIALVVGDFNGDGNPDVATANYTGNNVSVFLGTSDGTFYPVALFTVGTNPTSIAEGDFNGDGKMDLVTSNEGSNTVSVLQGTGISSYGNASGCFSTATNLAVGTQPHSVTVGDFNADGKTDMATANYSSDDVSVLLGDGAGGFGAVANFVVGTHPYSVTIGDFNGDGKTDLVTSNEGGNTISMLSGLGAGVFSAATNFGVGSTPRFVAVGDFDGNGKADMAVTNYTDNSVSVLLFSAPPRVTTQAVTNIAATTVTGNGTITDLGAPNPIAYGVCWSKSADPTTLEGKYDKGAATTAGAFTASITGLLPGTTYHVRAFATNTVQTVYGEDLMFTTSSIPSITLTSANSGSLSFDLIFDVTGTFYIDWGDGYLVSQTTSSTTHSTDSYIAGDTVKVYGLGIWALHTGSQNLTSLDVSACIKLKFLQCQSNQLTALDLSKNAALTSLWCYNNQLTALDVSENTALNTIFCYNNQLTLLNVTKNIELTFLWCSDNLLNALNVSMNTSLTQLYCNSNQLNYATLPQKKSGYTTYAYAPQANLAASVNGIVVDLSSQLTAKDVSDATQTTVYTWYTKTGTALAAGIDYNEASGVFTFLKNPSDSVYCTMENAAFPDFTGADILRTVNLKVIVCTNPTSGGTVAANQSGCYPFDPEEIAGSTLPAGNIGTLEYKWQRSTTSATTGFTDIASANATTYNPGELDTTTWYKRLARVECIADWTGAAESNVVKITVNTLPSEPRAGNNSFIYDGTGKTVSVLVGAGETVDWYDAPVGGDIVSAPRGVSVDLYSAYAEARNTTAGCVSAKRTKITMNIQKAPLIVTADSKTITYGDAIPELTISYSGFIGLDDAKVLDPAPCVSIAEDAGINGGEYRIKLSGGSSKNYDIRLHDGVLTVNKVKLTTTVGDKAISYGDPLPEFEISYSGFINGDKVSDMDVLPKAATTATPKSGAGTYDITLSGGLDTNYEFGYISGRLTIGKTKLSVIAEDKTMTYGEKVPELTIAYKGFLNGDDASVLDALPQIQPMVSTTGDVIGDFAISVSEGNDKNYQFEYTRGKLTVGKATLTATATSETITYGEHLPELTCTVTGFVKGDNASVLTKLPAASVASGAEKGAGVYPVTLSGGSAEKYTFKYVDGELKVGKALLTVTAENKKKYEGEEIPPLTLSYKGFVNGDTTADLDKEPVAVTTATKSSAVGTYDITASGGTDNNYTFTYVEGMLTVIQKETPTITWNNPAAIAYGTLLGEKQLNATASVLGTFIYTPAEGSLLNAGDAQELTVLFVPDDTVRYNSATKTTTVDVEKALLIVTSENKTIAYGQSLSEFTYTITGFVNSETDTVLASLPKATVADGEGINAGIYSITPSGGTAENYTFEYKTGELTVEKAILTVTADDKESIEGTIPALTYTYSGLIAGDSISDIDLIPVATTGATEASVAGTYPIIVSGGADNNYTFTNVEGKLVLIGKEVASISWNDQATITYGNAIGSVQLNATANIPGTFDYIPSMGTMLNAGNTQPLTVKFTPTDGTLYAVSEKTVYINVDKAPLTVTAADKAMKSGGEVPELTFTYTGFVNGDTEKDIDAKPAATTNASSASGKGEYEVIVTGGSDNNYSFVYKNGKLTIESGNGVKNMESVSLKVYPNPFVDHVFISTDYIGDGSYLLTDLNGKTIRDEKIENGNTRLTLSQLRSGIYLLQVKLGEGEKSFRLVKP